MIRRFHLGLIFLAGMLLFGLFSVMAGKELCWDLANYHYYNPYHYWYGRDQQDFWPSSFLHQYINPTMDFITFFLINHLSPRGTEFILGALHGLNFGLLFCIAKKLLKGPFSTAIALYMALLGMYGPTVIAGIGSIQNDNLVSIFILSFVLLQLSYLAHLQRQILFLAGICLGIAIGFKLTAGIFCASALVSGLLLPLSLRQKLNYLLLLSLGIIMGMSVTSGYWLIAMWHQHHNPFFPFFNHFFQSSDFSNTNWLDQRFMPKTILQTWFYPFFFAWNGQTSDEPFRDFRFAIVYGLFVMVALKLLLQRYVKQPATPQPLEIRWLYIFSISTYVIWQIMFSNSRYLGALEMLCPVLIYLLLKDLLRSRTLFTAILCGIFIFINVSMIPNKTIRAPWYDTDFFNVKLPASIHAIPSATVLIAYPAYALDHNPRPQSYLIPFFPAAWGFVGIPLRHEQYSADASTTKKIQAYINSRPSKTFYLLSGDRNMRELSKIALNFSLVPAGQCEMIMSDRQRISNQFVFLCPVTRI